MIFGEFAWQTAEHIEQQINVNLIGAINVTNVFLSQIVQNKGIINKPIHCLIDFLHNIIYPLGRIINICSHCSLQPLPGLSVYSASKAGLLAWSNALSIELRKFQIPVISLIPGIKIITR